MRNWLLALMFFAVTAWQVVAQPNSPPVRLALVVEEPSAATAADVLTVELSKRGGLQLLERAVIEMVYSEPPSRPSRAGRGCIRRPILPDGKSKDL
jgi:hypothetical protein